jgi:hypothetical protein
MTYRCTYGAPNRLWFKTDNGWASREWLLGEKSAYEVNILGRAA